MPAYYEQDRFRPPSEQFVEVRPQNEYLPQTHALNPARTAVQPLNPTVPQALAVNGPSLLQMAEDAANWYDRLQRDRATSRIVGDITGQLPAGKDFTIAITNPGSRSGPEHVDVYGQGEFPGAIHDPNTEVRVLNVKGTNPSVKNVDTVRYADSEGHPQVVSVHNAPPPAPQRWPNATEREPGGPRVVGEPRQLPADARGDRGYPGGRDPRGLA